MSVVRNTPNCNCASSLNVNEPSLALQVTPKATALNSQSRSKQMSLQSQAKTMQALYLPGTEVMAAHAVDGSTMHVDVPRNDLQGLANAIEGSGLTLRATYLASLNDTAVCAELSADAVKAALHHTGKAVKLDTPMGNGSFHFVTDGTAVTKLQFQEG
jgi:hypothetical protein